MVFTARQEQRTQLFIRSITNGVLSERDYLLSYTVAEFYQEMSLFIEEMERKSKYYESLKTKK